MKFLFAWRYFRSNKSTNAINIIAWISVIAIGVGSAALIVVLSVFNGFQDLVKGLYSDFYADMRIVPARGKSFHIPAEQVEKIKATKGVAILSFVAEEKGVLNGAFMAIVTMKGVDSQYTKVSRIDTKDHIIRGSFSLGTTAAPRVVVGAGIENAAGVRVESPVYPAILYLPNREASRLSSDDGLHSFQVLPSGTFAVQQDFDNKYVFSNLGFVKYMLGMGADEFSSIELKISDQPEAVKKRLQPLLGKDFLVETRYEQNKSLYVVMEVEKWLIYGILSLILIVAAFNMVGALTMLVLEKQKDIAVLKAMGANNELVKNIFLAEGLLLAGIGGVAGIGLATLVCWLQLKFRLIGLGGSSFIIDYYPVKMEPADFALVAVTIIVIALLAAWIPSRKAAMQLFSLKS